MAAVNPARLFGFGSLGHIAEGYDASFVWIKEEQSIIKNKEVVSKSGWSPYDGKELSYIVAGTWDRGERVFSLS
jgi:dihydroorotase-like cyclic amidohydrolase